MHWALLYSACPLSSFFPCCLHSFFFFLPLRNSLYPVIQLCLTLCDPLGLQPTRLLCSWDFSGKNAEMGCHFPLPWISTMSCITGGFLYPLSHWWSPRNNLDTMKCADLECTAPWVLMNVHIPVHLTVKIQNIFIPHESSLCPFPVNYLTSRQLLFWFLSA